ncbi:MAG: hypothetical protein AB8D78_09525 [Akkermansiaceae bacterium]
MTKNDLIYEWRHRTIHPANYLVPVVLVASIFIAIFGVVFVQFEIPSKTSVNSASVTYFLGDDTGRSWMLKAEEEGPFPGRLEIDDQSGLLTASGFLGARGADLWKNQSIALRDLPERNTKALNGIAPKGIRYFPSPEQNESSMLPENQIGKFDSYPVLIPFEREAVSWIPKSLPPFEAVIEEGTRTSAWRFLLHLRSNGTVAQCFSLSGGSEASLAKMTEYLTGMKFHAAAEKSRWLGLRVEFLNKEKDEPNPE